MDPFSLEAYDYILPPELIAQSPAQARDESRLLVLDRAKQSWSHHRFTELSELLAPTDLLVANNTRVLRARLLGKRILDDATDSLGGKVEFLLLERVGPKTWEGMFHASAKHKPGVRFLIPTPDGKGLRGKLIRGASDSPHGTVVAEFDRDPVDTGAGEIPLPHYIGRNLETADEERYQTVYARNAGSAAAPTAGLHFTPRVFEKLRARGIGWEEVTLNVGLGTFRPVKSADIRMHSMHDEAYRIEASTADRINQARAEGHRIVGVGTTSVRTLESAYRDGKVQAGEGRTSIFIYPGGQPIQVVSAMITNFHLPKSTLLMMISAFAGRELVLRAYADAVREQYRFFSYGDAMLIL